MHANCQRFSHGCQLTDAPGTGWVSLQRDLRGAQRVEIIIKEKKTWEDALEHCREDDTELTSLISETDLLLAQREIWKAQTTDHVWIGLRYLADSWLWVNGDPLEYEAWPQQGDQDQRCPNWGHTCGALTKEGLWRSRDCREKLHFICV
ncbi:dromaiocalcin-1-like [Myripristis murdjan]|uniref:dromaiocalcin-1-like n=1 Tax=Myripristis murdjan TaxID=586833 RepID=UPI001175CCBC|nr:dromaiocalcin-1-like [Myripristis murdjan]